MIDLSYREKSATSDTSQFVTLQTIHHKACHPVVGILRTHCVLHSFFVFAAFPPYHCLPLSPFHLYRMVIKSRRIFIGPSGC